MFFGRRENFAWFCKKKSKFPQNLLKFYYLILDSDKRPYDIVKQEKVRYKNPKKSNKI